MIKKSDLYASLWSSCDELRGGMDASQYKDYVLVLLFIKYVSDKYAGQPYAPITIPRGASFKDMVALKGKSDIGDQIMKKIIGPLSKENKLSEMPDFNNADKLGTGKEMVDRLLPFKPSHIPFRASNGRSRHLGNPESSGTLADYHIGQLPHPSSSSALSLAERMARIVTQKPPILRAAIQ